jgi:dihydrodipicolinate synthase/N-acetylneuraminate lyase
VNYAEYDTDIPVFIYKPILTGYVVKVDAVSKIVEKRIVFL